MTLRKEKVAYQMRREIGELLQKEVKDARIGFVTVTSVDISPDLRNAKVYVTILTDNLKERNKTFRGLKSASSYMSGELANRMHLKFAPKLTFLEDKGQMHAIKIEKILQKINSEKSEPNN